MKSADLIKELMAAGCELKRHNGGAIRYGGHPLPEKLFRSLIRKRISLMALSGLLKKWREFNPPFSGDLYVLLSGRRDAER